MAYLANRNLMPNAAAAQQAPACPRKRVNAGNLRAIKPVIGTRTLSGGDVI